MLLSTLYIMLPVQLQRLKLLRLNFRRRYIYKKLDGLSDHLCYKIIIYLFLKKKNGYTEKIVSEYDQEIPH